MWATMIVALFLTSPDRIAETIDVTLSVQTETVASIQIQGNTATPDEEVRRMADVQVGMPFEATTVEAITGRLRATKRFESVEVRKRFASIADPSQVALVIIVDEGPVKIVMTGDPDAPTRVARKRLPNMLILPILNQEDGYGITYGARLTLPDPQWLGKRSRVTFPLTWGGTKQAAMDIEKRLDGGFIDRVTASASISRSQNLATSSSTPGSTRSSPETPSTAARLWSIWALPTATSRRLRFPADTRAIKVPPIDTRWRDAAISASSVSRCSRDVSSARIRIGRFRRTCNPSSEA